MLNAPPGVRDLISSCCRSSPTPPRSSACCRAHLRRHRHLVPPPVAVGSLNQHVQGGTSPSSSITSEQPSLADVEEGSSKGAGAGASKLKGAISMAPRASASPSRCAQEEVSGARAAAAAGATARLASVPIFSSRFAPLAALGLFRPSEADPRPVGACGSWYVCVQNPETRAWCWVFVLPSVRSVVPRRHVSVHPRVSSKMDALGKMVNSITALTLTSGQPRNSQDSARHHF